MVAIQTQTLSPGDWQRIVRGEAIKIPEETVSHDTKALLFEGVLEPCIAACKFAQEAIRAIDSDLPPLMVHFALERWKQIQILAEDCSLSCR